MLFGSVPFLFVFLPVTLLGYALAARRSHESALTWLTLASLVFYGWWGIGPLVLLVVSIVVNYALCIRIMAQRSPRLLTCGLLFNLGILGYFKYANFFLANVAALTGVKVPALEIALPLAISFYTFQQITYLVDAYEGKVRDTSFLRYVMVVTFFPHLIAGPIIHPREIIAQLSGDRNYRLTRAGLAVGLSFFAVGLFKKVVLADGMAAYSDPMFDSARDGGAPGLIEAWAGALAYTLQLYFDFSGYSDMAVGLAWMFGIRLPFNFDSPYKAVNIIDFWRRWHMTLSRFLREYVYFPLGGNRHGPARRYVNLMATMLVGGLWHGAAWTFVAWGCLHGLLLAVNHAWQALMRRLGHDPAQTTLWGRALSRAVTFVVVVFGWVLFRAQGWDPAAAIANGMLGLNGVTLTEGRGAGGGVIWIAGLLLFVWFAPNTQEWLGRCLPALASDPRHPDRRWPLEAAAPREWWLAPFVVASLCVTAMVVIARGDNMPNFIYMVF